MNISELIEAVVLIIGYALLIIGALWLLTHGHIIRGIAVLMCLAAPILIAIFWKE